MEIAHHIPVPELTSVAHSGDFADLVQRQARFVFRVANAVLRNPADAEDAVQEVFLKLHRTGAWRAMDDERGFLARTTWRVAVDRLPKRPVAMPELVTPSHESDVAGRDLEVTVHRLVDALPEELRQPLVLSALEELNSRQIAEILGIPEGTVRTRLMRARQLLKEKLGRV